MKAVNAAVAAAAPAVALAQHESVVWPSLVSVCARKLLISGLFAVCVCAFRCCLARIVSQAAT